MRCFLAIELPAEVRKRLVVLQERLGGLNKDVRWTRPEQIHLTLKFFGEVPDAQIASVCDATTNVAARHERFELSVATTGCFPAGGMPRVVWVGVAGPPPGLVTLQRECEQVYAALGFKPEGRAFSPHLTIGRVREAAVSESRIRAALREQEHFPAGTFEVNELMLFQSILGRDGATHVVVARAALR